MKLDLTRLIGAALLVAGGGLTWLISDHIFMPASEREYAAGDAIAVALSLVMVGFVLLVAGDRLFTWTERRPNKRDLWIVSAFFAMVIGVPLVVLNWGSLVGPGADAASEAEAEAAAPLPPNLLEETQDARLEAELALRRARELTDAQGPSNAAKPQAPR